MKDLGRLKILTVALLLPQAVSAAGTKGVEAKFDNVFIVITALGLVFLLLTLYFLSNVMKIYGGKIGQSLNYVGLGIFGVAIKEVISFMKIIFDYDVFGSLIKSEVVTLSFQYSINLLIFVFFAYGFYKMSSILKGVGK